MTSTQMQTISHGVMSAMAKPDKGLGPLGLFQYFRRNEIILNHAEPQGPQSSHFQACEAFLSANVSHCSWCTWRPWTFAPAEVWSAKLSQRWVQLGWRFYEAFSLQLVTPRISASRWRFMKVGTCTVLTWYWHIDTKELGWHANASWSRFTLPVVPNWQICNGTRARLSKTCFWTADTSIEDIFNITRDGTPTIRKTWTCRGIATVGLEPCLSVFTFSSMRLLQHGKNHWWFCCHDCHDCEISPRYWCSRALVTSRQVVVPGGGLTADGLPTLWVSWPLLHWHVHWTY